MATLEKISFAIILATVSCVLATGNDVKDAGAHSDRGGQLWFGPRLGKRSVKLPNDDNRQNFFKLLEAADALKYYYEQLPYYENQVDEPEIKVTKEKLLERSLPYDENVVFSPRLGRRIGPEIPPTPPDLTPDVHVSRKNTSRPKRKQNEIEIIYGATTKR